jgi:hypothetical protein
MSSIAAAAGRQIGLGIGGKNRRRNQREAENSHQQNWNDATH